MPVGYPQRIESARLVLSFQYGQPTLRQLERFCEEARQLGVDGETRAAVSERSVEIKYPVVPVAKSARV